MRLVPWPISNLLNIRGGINHQRGWKHWLNNLRLVIQPLIYGNGLKRWLTVFPNAALEAGFAQLTEQMNWFFCPCVHQLNLQPKFSSA